MTLDEFLALPGAKRHDGGPAPVTGNLPIEICLRDGTVVRHERSGWLDWSHVPNAYESQAKDIIAYREAP